MNTQPIRVYIAFRPLLEQITDYLHFPKPKYATVANSRNNAYVTIYIGTGRGKFVFFDGEALTAEHSCERAARKAIHKLKTYYKLRITDYTSDQVKKYELFGKLIRHKCSALISETQTKLRPKFQSTVGQKPSQGQYHVSLDWVHFLGIVVSKVSGYTTPLETVWVRGHGHVAWISVFGGDRGCDMECIFSGPHTEASGAAQEAAKKAIFFLATLYNLEIMDVNYGDAYGINQECAQLEDAYLAFKSKVTQTKKPLLKRKRHTNRSPFVTGTSSNAATSMPSTANYKTWTHPSNR